MISADLAWQSVALEERLELISRAQASGILASLAGVLLIGCIAYGFDKVWLLFSGLGTVIFIYPLFASYAWRKEKPALILAYLAARAVARRYAYGYGILDLDMVLIFRGQMKELFRNQEEQEEHRQRQNVDLDNSINDIKDVWIVLMHGGLVLLSEKAGGAKLEFTTQITKDLVIREPKPEENIEDEKAIIIEEAVAARGKIALITSRHHGAQYVFKKRILALKEERQIMQKNLDKIKAAQSAK